MTNNNYQWPAKCEVVEHLSRINHEQWLDLRSMGIGGSDCAAVYGESPWTSPVTLWAQKSGRVERETVSNEAMEWGSLLEDSVALKYARDYNACVVKWPVMLRRPDLPHMLANLDFLVMATNGYFETGVISTWDETTAPPGDIEAILEIKTTGLVGRGSGYQWEDNGVPTGYWYQGLHYATVTGIERVRFAALVAGEGLVVRDRFYDHEERFNCEVTEALFWSFVADGTMPEVDGHNSTLDTLGKMYPTSEETTVDANEFLYETYRDYVSTKAELTALEKRAKELRAALESAVGSSEALAYEGQVLFTYKSTKDGEAFDAKAFKEAHPDIYARFVKPKAGHRVLRMRGEA